MFCSSCGVAVPKGLSYCNHCGAKLSTGDVTGAEIMPETLVRGVIAVFVCGLGAIAILLGVMKAILNLNEGAILGFALLSFLIMMVIEGVFIRMLLQRRHKPPQSTTTLPGKQQATNELDSAQPRILPEPIASVTDHTTRAFDPVYTERR